VQRQGAGGARGHMAMFYVALYQGASPTDCLASVGVALQPQPPGGWQAGKRACARNGGTEAHKGSRLPVAPAGCSWAVLLTCTKSGLTWCGKLGPGTVFLTKTW